MSGDFESITNEQYGQFEKQMGREAYEANVEMAKAQTDAVKDHAEVERVQAHRFDVTTELLRERQTAIITGATVFAVPVFVKVLRWALK